MTGAVQDSMRLVDARGGERCRVVIVADSSLLVEAIRIGFRRAGEFELVGHINGRQTSASTVVGARPDVVLLDDMDRSDRVIELIRDITRIDKSVPIILLGIRLDEEWLERAFAAGTTAVISKAAHPVALAMLVRETLSGHIFHRSPPVGLEVGVSETPLASEDYPLTARELEILQLVASGSTNGDVARQLWVTEQTVKFHLRNIYRKLDVANRTQASHFAHIHGLVSPMPAAVSDEPELAAVS